MSQVLFDPYLECSVDLAVALVNTNDPTDGTEDLRTPQHLAALLREHLVSEVPTPSEADLEQVRELREQLRKVFEAPDEAAAAGVLNRLLAEAGASPELTNHGQGEWHLHFTRPGSPLYPRLAAETAMALAVVIARNGFGRLGVCEGHRCVDVFVDESRNSSRRYCSPQVCGNRASVAAYRARERSSRSH